MRYYGVDYYPEQETREEVLRDAVRLREQGFNVVRIGEFVWSLLEPREQEFHIEWLLDVINILGREGISCVVCTPTACPPIWLYEEHPEIAYVDNRGLKRPFGGRRHYCYNSEVYREYCRRIVTEIAHALQGNPYILGWHIDNELAQEATGRCHCPTCTHKFHEWLRQKYGTIEEFNRRAGTVFWSQSYQRFEQIPLPSKTIEISGENPLDQFFDNPTLRLDFERFCSESLISFAEEQQQILRRYSKLPLTTNTTGLTTCGIDYYRAFVDLDVVSVDEYPRLRYTDLKGTSASFAFIRGIKDGQDFWVVETSSGGGQGSWAREGVSQPYPGTLRQMAVHAMASGADLFTYFQYKTFRYGAEQLEAAVMDVDGVERRRNREFWQAAQDIRELTPLLDQTVLRHEAAVCFDYDCYWAIRIKPFSKTFDYRLAVTEWHRRLNTCGIPADIIPLDETIFQYRLIILPTAVMLPEGFREKLKAYVEAGGVVLATYLTAYKNTDNNADRVSTPAGLTDLFGMRVGEVDVVHDDTKAEMLLNCNGQKIRFLNDVWTESLELDSATPLMTYTDTFRAGETAAAVHPYGKGLACYLGTEVPEKACESLLCALAKQAQLHLVPIRTTQHSDVVVRWREEGTPVYFLFNGEEEEATMEILEPLQLVQGGSVEVGTLRMPPKSLLVCQTEPVAAEPSARQMVQSPDALSALPVL